MKHIREGMLLGALITGAFLFLAAPAQAEPLTCYDVNNFPIATDTGSWPVGVPCQTTPSGEPQAITCSGEVDGQQFTYQTGQAEVDAMGGCDQVLALRFASVASVTEGFQSCAGKKPENQPAYCTTTTTQPPPTTTTPPPPVTTTVPPVTTTVPAPTPTTQPKQATPPTTQAHAVPVTNLPRTGGPHTGDYLAAAIFALAAGGGVLGTISYRNRNKKLSRGDL